MNNEKEKYLLSYHLKKSNNLRIKGKLRRLISFMANEYGCYPVFTKRRIWFLRGEKKIMQVIVEDTKLFLKIRTEKGWVEIRMKEDEDLRRINYIINKL